LKEWRRHVTERDLVARCPAPDHQQGAQTAAHRLRLVPLTQPIGDEGVWTDLLEIRRWEGTAGITRPQKENVPQDLIDHPPRIKGESSGLTQVSLGQIVESPAVVGKERVTASIGPKSAQGGVAVVVQVVVAPHRQPVGERRL